MKRFISIAPILAIILVAGCRQPEISNFEVAFVGDSHTERDGFSTTIRDQFPAGDVSIMAVGGTTTAFWLPNMNPPRLYETEGVPDSKPRIGFLLLGSNDAAKVQIVTPEQYRQNIEAIVSQWLQDGAWSIYIMTPPPFAQNSLFTAAQRQRLLDYATEVRAICEPDWAHLYGIFCGPDLATMMDPATDYIDPVHFNDQGNQKVVDAINAILDSAL